MACTIARVDVEPSIPYYLLIPDIFIYSCFAFTVKSYNILVRPYNLLAAKSYFYSAYLLSANFKKINKKCNGAFPIAYLLNIITSFYSPCGVILSIYLRPNGLNKSGITQRSRFQPFHLLLTSHEMGNPCGGSACNFIYALA